MSPRWGFGYLVCCVFYKHVAPLGLWWFVSSLVNWIDEAYTLRYAVP